MAMMEGFPLNAVKIKEEQYVLALKADIDFIKKFDRDRVLAGFRKTAKIDMQGKAVYQGWENSLIAGHCIGHYLTAAAQAVKAVDEQQLRDDLEYIINGLWECQEKIGSGFLSAAAIESGQDIYCQFDIEEGKMQGKTWVPWYALHKVLQGVLDVYLYTDNKQALSVAVNLADWVAERVAGWDEETRQRILKTEYGGMNDVLYKLYEVTKAVRYKEAAEKFDDPMLYEKLIDKSQGLWGIHANTTVPKLIGAVSRVNAVKNVEKKYTEKENKFLMYAELFWQRIVENHAYITGGISDMEHLREDGMLDSTRTQCNCESCCAHNMLKLSKGLFVLTGKKKYADYYENTLRNAIMGSINLKTGATTYFSPMATGYYKVFSKPNPADSMMWCCTGTGMENFTKLGDSIYFKEGDCLYVNQYIESEVYWQEKGIVLKQNANIKRDEIVIFTIEQTGGENAVEASFKFRKPNWIKGEMNVEVSVDKADAGYIVESDEDYVQIIGKWKNKANIKIQLPMMLEAVGLPDCESVLGFRYGITTLAAKLGMHKMGEETWAGIDLTAPSWKFVGNSGVKLDIKYAKTNKGILESEYLKLKPGIKLEDFKQNAHHYFEKLEGKEGMEFVLKCTDAIEKIGHELIFVSYDRIVNERYGIYWYFEE